MAARRSGTAAVAAAALNSNISSPALRGRKLMRRSFRAAVGPVQRGLGF